MAWRVCEILPYGMLYIACMEEEGESEENVKYEHCFLEERRALKLGNHALLLISNLQKLE